MTIVYEYCKISYVMGVMAISDEIKMPIKATTSKLSIYFFIKNLKFNKNGGTEPSICFQSVSKLIGGEEC